jgi:HEAT repeat protein
MMNAMFSAGSIIFTVVLSVQIQTTALPTQISADEVVQRLAELGPGGLPATASPGVMATGETPTLPPREQLRLDLYRALVQLGDDALPALARGLGSPDVLVRRNVALFLLGGWAFHPALWQSRVNIRPALPALVKALQDDDSTVRAWAAQAIGGIGREAASAVPALIALLRNEDEGSRNSACIALRGIGTAAKDALPALRQALSDSSANVRGFAARAIVAIEGTQ